jgi:Vitamin K-dependent gamma-carboxylase
MTTQPLSFPDDMDTTGPAWLRAWNRFWLTPTDPTGLGFMRILCGLLLFYTHLTYSYDLMSYLGPHGWLDKPTQIYLRKEAPIYLPENNWNEAPRQSEERGEAVWSIFFHVDDPNWVVVIHIAILVILLLFTVGLWTRVTSVLAWMGAMCYVQRLPTNNFGQDTMLIILMMYFMINSGAALSVDRWLELRRLRREQGSQANLALMPSWSANLATRLIQVHFCIIYLASGSSKLLGAAWWNGTAMWLTLANYNFAPMRVGLYNELLYLLSRNEWLWQICMTAGVVFTLFTEISLPYLIWSKRWRPFMVSCSVLMHLGIGLIMGLSVFSLFMLVMVLAFVPPETIRAFVDEWGEKVRRLIKQMRRGRRALPRKRWC